MTLTFPADLEAAIFASTPHEILTGHKVHMYAPKHPVPGVFLYSDKYELISRLDVWELSLFRYRNLKFMPVPYGHFFPLTHPGYTAERLHQLLSLHDHGLGSNT